MIHIRAIAQRQVNLDQCSGEAILQLRACVRSMESSRLRIDLARKIALPLLPTPAGPEVTAAFERAARIEEGIQRAIEKKWRLQAARWNGLTGLGCKLRDSPGRSPYPEFPYRIVEPATALLLPVAEPIPPPSRFRLFVRVARLESEASLNSGGNHEWNVRWTR
jgi:hypothetical protein